jgi:hypothetical protein
MWFSLDVEFAPVGTRYAIAPFEDPVRGLYGSCGCLPCSMPQLCGVRTLRPLSTLFLYSEILGATMISPLS